MNVFVIFVDVYGYIYIWIYMDIFGYIWRYMDTYSCIELGRLWVCMYQYVSSLSEPMNAIILVQVGVEPK